MKKIRRLFVVDRGGVGSDERFTLVSADYREALAQYREARIRAACEAEASKRPQGVVPSSYAANEPVEAEMDAFGRLIGEDGGEIEYFNERGRKIVFGAVIDDQGGKARMKNGAKTQTMEAAEEAEKARKLADAPETKARFERILRELAQSFADINKRDPSGEEMKALRSYAQVSAAFLAMADEARRGEAE